MFQDSPLLIFPFVTTFLPLTTFSLQLVPPVTPCSVRLSPFAAKSREGNGVCLYLLARQVSVSLRFPPLFFFLYGGRVNGTVTTHATSRDSEKSFQVRPAEVPNCRPNLGQCRCHGNGATTTTINRRMKHLRVLLHGQTD